MPETISICLRKIGNNRVRLDFDDSGTRKYWDGAIGFKAYMEAKKAILEERETQVGDVSLDSYEDDGVWIHLTYSAEFDTDKVLTAVELAEQIVAEIEGAAEMRLDAAVGARGGTRGTGVHAPNRTAHSPQARVPERQVHSWQARVRTGRCVCQNHGVPGPRVLGRSSEIR